MPESISNTETSSTVGTNEKNLEILITKLIPTSQYFERSFEMMQGQIKDLKQDMNRRFEQVDRRFEQVDKRFEQVDKRFEQVDKRFEQIDKRFEQVDAQFERINIKLDAIIDRVDRRIDEGLRESRSLTIRLFSFAMVFAAISMAGLMGKMLEIF